MSTKDTGGPALPSLNAEMTGIDSDGVERWDTEESGGMTLRDYFAAHAPIPREDMTFAGHCAYRYQYADAMLEARK